LIKRRAPGLGVLAVAGLAALAAAIGSVLTLAQL